MDFSLLNSERQLPYMLVSCAYTNTSTRVHKLALSVADMIAVRSGCQLDGEQLQMLAQPERMKMRPQCEYTSLFPEICVSFVSFSRRSFVTFRLLCYHFVCCSFPHSPFRSRTLLVLPLHNSLYADGKESID